MEIADSKFGFLKNKESKDEPQPVQKEAMQNMLRKVENDADLKVTSVKVQMGSKKGDNYMSFMYSAEVKVTKGNNPCSYSLMIKALPNNPAHRGMLNEIKAFVREVQQYTVTFPAFQAFEQSKGSSALFQSYPRCFHGQTDGESDHLILEDLRPAGFKMADRKAGLDQKHATLVMKQLAYYHALSYAMGSGDPEKLEKMFPHSKPLLGREHMKKHTEFLTDAMSKTIEGLENSSEGTKLTYQLKWLKNVRDAMAEELPKATRPKKGTAVVTHGDFWVNNIMFLYQDDQPVELKFVDFQFSLIGSRAHDIVFFLLSSLTGDLRRKIQEDLLETYNDSFVNHLKLWGVDASRFTLHQLQDDIKENYVFGLAVALALLPIITAEVQDAPDFGSMTQEEFDNGLLANEKMNKVYEGKRFLSRALDVVNDSMLVM